MSELYLEEIKKQIDEIVKIADELPEKYQQKGFEVLLSKAIDILRAPVLELPPGTEKEGPTESFIIPINIKAFLRQYNLKEEEIHALFLLEGKAVIPTYTISTDVISKSQIQLALLLALENALKNIGFEFDTERVREMCRERGVYDSNNFATNFRYNSRLFNNLEDKEHVTLSPDGKSELADTVSELISNG